MKIMLLQIQGHVQELLTAAARPRFKWDCPANSLPPHWAPQQSNTELFEVDLASPEIGSLMEAMCDLHYLTIVKVSSFKLYSWDIHPRVFPMYRWYFDVLCSCTRLLWRLLQHPPWYTCMHPRRICSGCASGYIACMPSVCVKPFC